MRMMDISDLAMRSFNELSAGQHQRVMLARGIAQEPSILLLDEPTANLDIRHQMDVIRLLKELSVKKGITVIMISHDLNLASKYSDNVVMMSEGSIFAVGKPEEVINYENIKKVYGVESEIIVRDGRPLMILQDPDFVYSDSGGKCSSAACGHGGETDG
jgi:iron complex transport system ATP-binding protein